VSALSALLVGTARAMRRAAAVLEQVPDGRPDDWAHTPVPGWWESPALAFAEGGRVMYLELTEGGAPIDMGPAIRALERRRRSSREGVAGSS
jgi:hypothetical protein